MTISGHQSKILLLLFLIFLVNTIAAQHCDKRTIVHFEYGKGTLIPTDRIKLDSIRSLISTQRYYIEIHGHTDIKGTSDYNTILANKRIKTVRSYLSKGIKSNSIFKESNHSEFIPLQNDTTEAAGFKNRRVEIICFPIEGDKLRYYGRQGSYVELPLDFFEPCAICDSKPVLNEILSEVQAAEQGIPLLTTEGDELITGGMVQFTYEPCAGKKEMPCIEIEAAIPGEILDSQMTIWNSVNQNGVIRWENTQRPVKIDRRAKKCGLTRSTCTSSWSNCDRPKPKFDRFIIIVPHISRYTDGKNWQPVVKVNNEEIPVKFEKDTIFFTRMHSDKIPQINLEDKGYSFDKQFRYKFSDTLTAYLKKKDDYLRLYEVPLKEIEGISVKGYSTRMWSCRDTMVVVKYTSHVADSIVMNVPSYDSNVVASKYKKSLKKVKYYPSTEEYTIDVYKAGEKIQSIDPKKLKMKFRKRKKIYTVKVK